VTPTDQPPLPSDGKVPIGPLATAVIAAVGGLVGAFFSQFLVPINMLRPPTLADVVWEFGITCGGVIVGALFFSWASKR
jgi:H+/Cl- antiporter ClcA